MNASPSATPRNSKLFGLPRRTAAIAGAGLALSLLGVGTAVTLAQTQAEAAVQMGSLNSSTAKAADGSQNVAPYGKVYSRNSYSGTSKQWKGVAKTYFVDKATGQPVGMPVYSALVAAGDGSGNYMATLTVTKELAGKQLVVFEEIYHASEAAGTQLAPTSIHAGATPIMTSKDINNAAKTLQVGALPGGTTASSTVTVPNPTGAPLVTKDANSGASLSTVASDNADGDKKVATDGQIKDVVNYTGLNVGTVYVLQTQLFDKTTGKMVERMNVKVFSPGTRDGSETVLIPVPAGSEGHTFVVYQTIWAGADALVGKHLDKVRLRPGATPVVRDNNPDNPWETVVVSNETPSNLPQCTVSGYVWKDANKNGAMDAGEEKVPGVQAALFGLTPGLNDYPGTKLNVPTQTTDANGFYKFTVPGDLCGRIYVDFNEGQYPADWKPFGFGESDLKTNDLPSGKTIGFDVAPGQNLERVDAGLRQGDNSVSGMTCSTDLQGFRVTLRTSPDGRILQTTTVDSTGRYAFNNVAPGLYYVGFDKAFRIGQPAFVVYENDFITVSNAMYGPNGRDFYNAAMSQPFSTDGKTSNVMPDVCGLWESPLVLDLNGNGKIDTSSAADQPAGATFDLFGTGTGVRSGWTAAGDGFLVRPNADGTVTSNKNLFGGSLGEGFAQLATLDTNQDGRVSGSELDGVKVWVDANNDHVSQAGEIKTLADYGITSLNTAFVNAPVANNGNVVVEHGSANTASGDQMVLGDAYFGIEGALDAANQAAANASAARTAATTATLSPAEQAALANAFAVAASK